MEILKKKINKYFDILFSLSFFLQGKIKLWKTTRVLIAMPHCEL